MTEIRRVKCYGGPAHGRIIKLRRESLNRFLYTPRIQDVLEHRGWSFNEPLVFKSRIEAVTYFIDSFHDIRYHPTRQRTIEFAYVEGSELLPHEQHEIWKDLQKLPWQFPEVSFLHEFDEWWAQAVYRHFGKFPCYKSSTTPVIQGRTMNHLSNDGLT